MTALLEQAFSRTAQLPETQQDKVAMILMETINAVDNRLWDSQFERSQDALAGLAEEALAEYHAGRTIKIND